MYMLYTSNLGLYITSVSSRKSISLLVPSLVHYLRGHAPPSIPPIGLRLSIFYVTS